MAESTSAITQLLHRAGAGDEQARDKLLRVVYLELRELAGRCMRRERLDHTLQPTALVHEAYLRLFGRGPINWRTHSHFVRGCARAMRQILVDYARKRGRAKRAGGNKVSLGESAVVACDRQPEILIALNDSLERLRAMDPRQAEVVEMLYFTGLTQQEAAEALGLSEITVRREWRLARAWLWNELREGV